MSSPSENASVAVLMPVFPRLPMIRASLASLREQTHPPDLVVLIDDGKNPDIKKLPDEISGPRVKVVDVETSSLPDAFGIALKQMGPADFVGFLLAGDSYAPERIAKCLAAMNSPDNPRPAAVSVTGVETVSSRGAPLPPDDPRARHFARLWAPGRDGVPMADWLGTGNFAGPASNIFVRRTWLEANALATSAGLFAYGHAILAGLQGQLAVLDEPLLRHHPVLPERNPTPKTVAEMLQMQVAVLALLKDKLAVSPETRRGMAAFGRAAWNNLSGLRADLFQQVVLRLASAIEPDKIRETASEILRSHGAAKPPPEWHALCDGGDPLDSTTYASALQEARTELLQTRSENRRLAAIAVTAQNSGWVRFGAWLGERSARRILEMKEASASAKDGDGPSDVQGAAPDDTAPTPGPAPADKTQGGENAG